MIVFQQIRVWTLCIFVLGVVAACGEGQTNTLPISPLEIESGGKIHKFKVELADTDRTRTRGLMFREKMGANRGMLFNFFEEQHLSFWMKNTPLSLDLVFIDKTGRIVSIATDAVPFSETQIPSRVPAMAVLEVNGGTTKRLGIKPNDVVKHSIFTSGQPK